MSDKWRAKIKNSKLQNDEILLLEFDIRRTILVPKNGITKIFDLLWNDTDFEEIKEIVSSFQNLDLPPNTKLAGISQPWNPLSLSSESLIRLAKYIDTIKSTNFLEEEGSIESGNLKLRISIAGGIYELPIKNKSDAKRFKDEAEKIKAMAKQSNDTTMDQFIEMIIKRINEILFSYNEYDLTGKLLARFLTWIEKERQREIELNDIDTGDRIDYDNERLIEKLGKIG